MNDFNNLTKAFVLAVALLGLPDTARAQLSFQPNPVQFTISGPGAIAGPAFVAVTSTSSITSLSITSIFTTGGNWLCAVTSGTNTVNVYIGSGPCGVATSTTQLAANQTYTGTINVQSGSQFGTINVNLAVGNTGGGSSGVAAFPGSVSFNATPGGQVNPQTVQVTFNGSPQTINGFSFTPNSGVSFLNTSINGSVATLSVNNTNLSNGVYSGTETLFTQNGSVNVPVTLTIGSGGSSNIVATPNPVNFTIPTGGSAPTQNVTLTLNGFPVNTNNPPTATTTTGQPWLQATASPVSGTVIVGVNGSLLSPGTYSGTVTAVTEQGTASFQVNLTVGSGGSGGTGGVVASPGSISFNAFFGGQAGSQNVSVTVNGVPTSITNFSFTPNSGVSFVNTSINGSVATLSVNNTNLSNGVYTGTETLFTQNGSVNVPVTLTIGGGASNIVATPNPVNFTIPAGGSAPTQNVMLTLNGFPVNTNNPPTATTTTGQPWLQATASPVAGTVIVSINGSLLSPGTYSGTVTAVTEQGTASFQVNLTVGISPIGVVATPSSVSFNAVFGGQAGSQNVSVTVNGVPTSITGFSFTPGSGGISFVNTSLNGSVATLSVNNTNLSNGVYTGTETLFTQNGSSVNVPVTLTIGGGGSNLVFTPNPVNFTITTGGSAPVQSVTALANGTSTNVTGVTATTTTGQVWLQPSVSPSLGLVDVRVNGSFLAPGTYSGTVTVSTLQGTGSFQVNLTVGGTPGGLSTGGSMAHLAFAGFWKTIITLMNTGTAVSQARLNFFDDNGNPLPVSLTFPQISPFAQSPVSSLDRTISPGAILTMEITGPDFQAVQTGWAQLQTSGNITGFAVFRQSVGSGQHEAVVPLESRNAGSYVLAFDNTSGFVTGVALANTSAQSAFIAVIIRDDNGTVLQSNTIPLAALGHTSFNLTDRFPVTAQRRGLVEFQTPAGGGISVLGLRFNPAGTFSTIPLAAK